MIHRLTSPTGQESCNYESLNLNNYEKQRSEGIRQNMEANLEKFSQVVHINNFAPILQLRPY